MNETNRSAKHYDIVVIGSSAAGHHGATQTNHAEQSSVQCSDGNSGSSHAA